jgi:hypothetical protein
MIYDWNQLILITIHKQNVYSTQVKDKKVEFVMIMFVLNTPDLLMLMVEKEMLSEKVIRKKVKIEKNIYKHLMTDYFV